LPVTRRALLVAFLVYVALDLSLPAMPGAFVFDTAGSVEGARMNRLRHVAELVAAPKLPRLASAPPEPRVVPVPRPRPLFADPARLAGRVPGCLPRAVCGPPSLAEDPH